MKMSQTKESLPTETSGLFLFNLSFLSSLLQMNIRTVHPPLIGIRGKQRMELALVAISTIKDFFYVEKRILATKLSKCVYQQDYPSTSQTWLLDSMISAQVNSRPLKWEVF